MHSSIKHLALKMKKKSQPITDTEQSIMKHEKKQENKIYNEKGRINGGEDRQEIGVDEMEVGRNICIYEIRNQ